MPNFAERFKLLRNELKLSQMELSLKLGIPRTTITSWETTDRVPELSKLEDLADFFGVSLDYLIGRSSIRRIHYDKDLLAIIKALENMPPDKIQAVLQFTLQLQNPMISSNDLIKQMS